MKKALTMGELLVTMAIIGTVAVLVLPGFLKDYHNRLYVTRLKKVYETLEHAINQACIDYSVSNFAYTPYVKWGTNTETNKLYQQDFLDKYFKKSGNQITNPFAPEYRTITGEQGTSRISNANHGWAKLASGEAVSLFCSAGASFCIFRVDVTSIGGPNIGGRDMFNLYIDKNTNKIYDPFPKPNVNEEEAPDDAADCRTKFNHHGNGCFGRILKDNWEMKY